MLTSSSYDETFELDLLDMLMEPSYVNIVAQQVSAGDTQSVRYLSQLLHKYSTNVAERKRVRDPKSLTVLEYVLSSAPLSPNGGASHLFAKLFSL